MMEEIKIDVIPKSAETTLTQNGCAFTSGKKIKVAIIGAGFAGLCAARHIFAEDSPFTGVVFEQSSNIGGTWVYNDATGKDRYGVPIHSSLYYDLWTNLPKEVMEFPDFKFKPNERSYLQSSEVLQYLVDYADHFNLQQHIKLNHLVKCVAPLGKSWSVSALDLANNMEHVSVYDAVMICSGPNSIPVYPKVDGFAKFSGRQLHSREFRRVSPFEGKRVLIIGLGPSGVDITYKLLGHAKKIILSHNKPERLDQNGEKKTIIDIKGVLFKPEVLQLEDKTVTFADNTSEDVDVIIYCTGYTFNYPYLTKDCGIIVDQCVSPLYKQFINIEYPTMAIFGLPRPNPYQYLIDFQVRTFLKTLTGEIELPEKSQMENELEEENRRKKELKIRKKEYHKIKMDEEGMGGYFKEIQIMGKLDPIPKCVIKIYVEAYKYAISDFENFRQRVFKIEDDENYSVIHPEKKVDVKTVTFKLEGEKNDEKKVEVVIQDKEKENETEVNEDDVEISEVSSESGMERLSAEEVTFTRSSSDSDIIKRTIETFEVKAVIEKNYKNTENDYEMLNTKNSHENDIVNIVKNVESHEKDVD